MGPRRSGPGTALWLAAFIVALGACEHQTKSAVDSIGPGETQSSPPKEADSIYTVRGACPFECCQYGKWTLRNDVVLRNGNSASDDSIGVLRAGDQVTAQSGVVVMNPTGLAVVTSGKLRFDGDTGAPPPVKVGDTLTLLNYIGEGYRSVRWHDRVFTMEEQWDSTGTRGAKLVRAPQSTWWVHFARGAVEGWGNMKGVGATGSDRCG